MFLRSLEEGGFGERMKNARPEEKYIGTADLPSFYRKPYGPGWALVGDASCHKDPIIGWGITDAFREAEFLSEALDAGWSGRQSLAEALAECEQRRNAASGPMYDLACLMARLPAYTPQMLQQLFGAAPAA
jgi:flavin-dependent dehydrogenase